MLKILEFNWNGIPAAKLATNIKQWYMEFN